MSFFVIILLLLLLGALFYSSWSISLGVYLHSICACREQADYVALTFDDGVDPRYTPQLLELLAKYNARATLFIVGEKAAAHPEIVRMIHQAGHTIGNHSMWHRSRFPLQRTAAICDEIERCNEILREITGAAPIYFRPPFGVTNPMIGGAVRRTGMRSIGWSIRSFDTVEKESKKVVKRVAKRIKGGDIVLLHDTLEGVIETTEALLQYIAAKGYKAVSIDELLIDKK